MFSESTLKCIQEQLDTIRQKGLYKKERFLKTPQQSQIRIEQGNVVNLCSNNYLGLANHQSIRDAAKNALDQHGFGMASVRFICGSHVIHKELENKISDFLGMEDAILFSSCFDANAGLFETFLGKDDAVFSDTLNHASIIDGIRLSKAERFRYSHGNMNELENLLKHSNHKIKLIATDGVFSMDGDIAKLNEICSIAERNKALVMVDDSHATGFFGSTGRGTPEYSGVQGRVDIITSTFGKALGGASGGFVAAKKEIVELLRQRSRPYLFSNSLAPMVVAATLEAINLISTDTSRIQKLKINTQYFRERIVGAGFEIKPGFHPIVPVMLGDEKLAVNMANNLLEEGIFVVGLSYPVVPKNQARIRVQISAAHEIEDLNRAIAAFVKVSEKMRAPALDFSNYADFVDAGQL
jgi:glycine C-acetyltransferase